MNKRAKINTIRLKSIPHIYNTNSQAFSSNTTVAIWFLQFVRMASTYSKRPLIKSTYGKLVMTGNM